jgi:primase-polymerase (primpol)-like protein
MGNVAVGSPVAEKPAVGFDAAGVPAELKNADRWLLWKYTFRKGATKPTKVPLTVSGAAASSTDPKTWCSFDLAVKSLEAGVHKADGIGVLFR